MWYPRPSIRIRRGLFGVHRNCNGVFSAGPSFASPPLGALPLVFSLSIADRKGSRWHIGEESVCRLDGVVATLHVRQKSAEWMTQRRWPTAWSNVKVSALLCNFVARRRYVIPAKKEQAVVVPKRKGTLLVLFGACLFLHAWCLLLRRFVLNAKRGIIYSTADVLIAHWSD